MEKHRQRVKARKYITISKRKKSNSFKYILLTFVSLLLLLTIFRILCVKTTKMNAVISVLDITQISKGGSYTYHLYRRTPGENSFVLKYPSIYVIKAKSETDEDILFETTEPNQFWYNSKFEIEYTVVKVFNKTQIKNVERIKILEP